MSEVVGYDPATGEAQGHIQGMVLSRYNELLERGEEEKAEELRQANALEQKALAKEIKDFDPKHNQPHNSKRTRVKQTYDDLLELSEESEDDARAKKARKQAEVLREHASLGKQHKHARALIDEFGLEVF